MGTKQRRTEEGERSLKTARIAQTQISINHKKGGGGPCPTPNLRIWHISSYKDCFSSQNRKKRKKIKFFSKVFLVVWKKHIPPRGGYWHFLGASATKVHPANTPTFPPAIEMAKAFVTHPGPQCTATTGPGCWERCVVGSKITVRLWCHETPPRSSPPEEKEGVARRGIGKELLECENVILRMFT